MGRIKRDNVPFTRRTRPEFIEIVDAFLKMLEANDGMVMFQPYVPEPEKIEPPKERFGISPNDFLKSLGKGALIIEDTHSDLDTSKSFCEKINHRIQSDTPSMNITSKLHQEKDYTAWQSDPLMQDIYNSCLWDASGENQCYPDGVEEYQRKHKDLWGQLNEAKRNNKTQRCNEIMTEMMERIYNE